jgi:hypothetical protein
MMEIYNTAMQINFLCLWWNIPSLEMETPDEFWLFLWLFYSVLQFPTCRQHNLKRSRFMSFLFFTVCGKFIVSYVRFNTMYVHVYWVICGR